MTDSFSGWLFGWIIKMGISIGAFYVGCQLLGWHFGYLEWRQGFAAGCFYLAGLVMSGRSKK